MEFNEFKDWALLGLLTGAVYILWSMKESIQDLNIKMAVICQQVESHDQRIERLEEGA